jgi:heme/copper-type cytochrome/quinol oxidase subunit 1
MCAAVRVVAIYPTAAEASLSPVSSPFQRVQLLLTAGLILTLIGVLVFVLVPSADVAWFAYAPVSGEVFTPGVSFRAAHLWGAAAGIVGLVATSWAAGYLAGRRAGPSWTELP